jgi:hypothetical protein
MMCPTIDKLASCEIRAVILFFHAKNVSAAEIHHYARLTPKCNEVKEL